MFQKYVELINLFDWRWKLCKIALKLYVEWQTAYDGNDHTQAIETIDSYIKEI